MGCARLCVPFLARVNLNLLLWHGVLPTNTPGFSGSGNGSVLYAPFTPSQQVSGQCVRPGLEIPFHEVSLERSRRAGKQRRQSTARASAELRGPWALRGPGLGRAESPPPCRGRACRRLRQGAG